VLFQPLGGTIHREYRTLAETIRAASGLHDEFGRQGLVYAISPEGREAQIPREQGRAGFEDMRMLAIGVVLRPRTFAGGNIAAALPTAWRPWPMPARGSIRARRRRAGRVLPPHARGAGEALRRPKPARSPASAARPGRCGSTIGGSWRLCAITGAAPAAPRSAVSKARRKKRGGRADAPGRRRVWSPLAPLAAA
jgi:hypothetical protein